MQPASFLLNKVLKLKVNRVNYRTNLALVNSAVQNRRKSVQNRVVSVHIWIISVQNQPKSVQTKYFSVQKVLLKRVIKLDQSSQTGRH